MTGWAALTLLLAAAAGLLRLLGGRGALLQIALAGLMLGAAGYALQGRPGLAAARARGAGEELGPPLSGLRHAFFGSFSASERWLIIAESYARRGKTADSVNLLKNALGDYPGDPQLWIGLGNALVEHAGVLTPPAEFAYRRAAEVAPGHPAPAYFLGLAHVRSGERDPALALWRATLAAAPADAGWRPLVEDSVAALESTGRRPPLSPQR